MFSHKSERGGGQGSWGGYQKALANLSLNKAGGAALSWNVYFDYGI